MGSETKPRFLPALSTLQRQLGASDSAGQLLQSTSIYSEGITPVVRPETPPIRQIQITEDGGIPGVSPIHLLSFSDPFSKDPRVLQPAASVEKAKLRNEIKAQLIEEHKKADQVLPKEKEQETLPFKDPAVTPSFIEICRQELYRRLKVASDKLESSAKDILAIKRELDELDVFVSRKSTG